MSTAVNRRERLRELIETRYSGNRKWFASASGLSESRIGQLLSPNYRNGTSFGEKAARAIEAKLRLPTNYFDQAVDGQDSGESEEDFVRIEADGYSLQKGLFQAVEIPKDAATAFFGPYLKVPFVRFSYAPDDGMKPTIDAGDLIFSRHHVVSKFEDFHEDGIFIFLYDNRFYLRRLQRVGERLAVKCDNPLYDTWYIDPHDLGNKLVIFSKVVKKLPMQFVSVS